MEKHTTKPRRKQIRKDRFVGVRITDELYNFLEVKASLKLKSVSALVLEAIMEHTGFVPHGHDTKK